MDAINRIEGKKEMRQETVNIYKFEELPESIQQKLIDKHRYIGVEHDWWEGDWWDLIADEIEQQGGRLIEFGLNGQYIVIEIDYPIDFAKAIVANHGSSCDTYIISEDFINGELSGKEYVKAIAEEYLSMLMQEYEHLTSDEYVRETLIDAGNEYYEDGRAV